jgi:hypothetical protein
VAVQRIPYGAELVLLCIPEITQEGAELVLLCSPEVLQKGL